MGPAVALGQVGVPEEEDSDTDVVGNWLESPDCLPFSKIDNVSDKTLFFRFKSFTSASCSSR